MRLMTIGEFAERTRLSIKALRLYHELKLLLPARVDPGSGYRFYSEDQVEPARLVGNLRRAGMPLGLIASVMTMDGAQAAQAVADWWAQTTTKVAQQQALVSYLQARLAGRVQARYDIKVRSMPARQVLTISRHLHIDETDQFFIDAFARLLAAGPGLDGIAGVPFLIFHGEVSDDSDGPIELCRPVASIIEGELPGQAPGDAPGQAPGDARAQRPGQAPGQAPGYVQLRIEPAHDEAYIRLAMKDMGSPALLPAADALERWVTDQQRRPAGALRQLLIADQRTATPDTPVCDLTLPVR